eukprot:CAMPEP_0115667584 /NCGR_PEP_ID=MMETSP0272-20121206/50019_1 /TAXON_ID=71861 /ORGANISM="Scrippsiella trochoidea, Strain CCMP3099" /LENGTH=202 /DNA_ID=CAMNT_0003106143 /DNA_START=15 /DNA_END=618 /DNA_ORIENTATION=+
MADPAPMLPGDASRPQIIYALVTRGPTLVLAEHAVAEGTFQQATMQILPRIEVTSEWKSYIYGDYAFHCLMEVSTGVWFVCMADRDMGRRLPFAMLSSLQESFNQWYAAPQIASASNLGMQLEFYGEIQACIEKYNAPDADRVASLSAKVRQVNDTLMDNIDKILERQDKIDVLVEPQPHAAPIRGGLQERGGGGAPQGVVA